MAGSVATAQIVPPTRAVVGPLLFVSIIAGIAAFRFRAARLHRRTTCLWQAARPATRPAVLCCSCREQWSEVAEAASVRRAGNQYHRPRSFRMTVRCHPIPVPDHDSQWVRLPFASCGAAGPLPVGNCYVSTMGTAGGNPPAFRSVCCYSIDCTGYLPWAGSALQFCSLPAAWLFHSALDELHPLQADAWVTILKSLFLRTGLSATGGPRGISLAPRPRVKQNAHLVLPVHGR